MVLQMNYIVHSIKSILLCVYVSNLNSQTTISTLLNPYIYIYLKSESYKGGLGGKSIILYTLQIKT